MPHPRPTLLRQTLASPCRVYAACWTLAALLASTAANAAPAALGQPEIHFQRLTRADGLDDTVEAIVEGPRGFVWLATPGGLHRYDGYDFKVYRHDPEDSYSLSQTSITELLVDHTGALWVGTHRGLNRFNRDSGGFDRFFYDPATPASLGNGTILALAEDRSGNLWVGTYRGLHRLDRSTDTFRSVATAVPGSDGHPGAARFRAILEDRHGQMWIGTEAGLYQLDADGGWSAQPLQPASGSSAGYAAYVRALLETRNGDLWVGTHQGLFQLAQGAPSWAHYMQDPADPGSLSNNRVDTLLEDRDGILWVGTDGGGINLFDAATKTFRHLRHDPNDPTSLGSHVVRQIYEDSKGDLWIGTFSGGVAFHHPDNRAFIHYRHEPHNPQTLSHPSVLALFEDTDGSLWIGTEEGLDHLDPENRDLRTFRHDPLDPTSLNAEAVLAIERDTRGRLWVGTYHGGLSLLDPATGTARHFLPDPRDPQSLSNPHVWDLHEDRHGRLWLATFGGVNRLERLDGERAAFTHHTYDPEDPTSVGGDGIVRIYEDRSGQLWLAALGGLSRYDEAADGYLTFRHVPGDPTSLSHDHVLTLLEDRQARFWVGTGNSLDLFDRETGHVTETFGNHNGLPDGAVYSLLEDSAGQIWISTNRGLSRLDPTTRRIITYDASDGVLAAPFNKNAAMLSKDGEMLFGGTRGLTRFAPEQVVDNLFVPPVVLTDFQIFNRSVTASHDDRHHGANPLRQQISETRQIVLRHDQSVFTLSFAALSFQAPEKNRYSYRLEPFDKEWSTIGTQRSATYTNLDPGEYTFRVKGSNNSGLWSTEGAVVSLQILPPWWATWWFRIAVVLAAVASLLLGHRSRTRRIRLHNRRLRAEVSERRRAEAKHEVLLERLGIQNDELAAKNDTLHRFAYSVSHDLKAPLITIKGFLGMLEQEPSPSDSARASLRRIGESAEHMNRLLDELLELSRTGVQQRPSEDVELSELAREAAALVEGRLRDRGVEVVIDPIMPSVRGDRRRLLEVYQNLIDNAVKFMGEQPMPRIEIGARRGDTEVECWVRDNGTGIAAEDLGKIFDLFERVDETAEGTGLGLALVQRIVEVHGGRIRAESEGLGHGATFHFTLQANSRARGAEPASLR